MTMLYVNTFIDIINYPTPSDVVAIVTYGYQTVGDGGHGFYKRVASQPSIPGYAVSATGAFFSLCGPYISPKHFDVIGDGVADDTQAMQDLFTWLLANGGNVVADNLKLKVSGELILNVALVQKNWSVSANNSVIIPTNSISSSIIKIVGSSPPHKGRISGFTFDLRNNTILMAAISKYGTAFVDILDNVFITDSGVARSAGSSLILCGQSDNSNPNTGCFWSVIAGNAVRPYSGMVDHSFWPEFGIRLIGAQNATVVRENSFTNVKKAVGLEPDTTGYLANAVTIEKNWFESVERAVRVDQDPGYYWPTGLVIERNRVESTDAFFELNARSAGTIHDPSCPPILRSNYVSNGSVPQYVINNSGALIQTDDLANFGSPTDVNQLNNGDRKYRMIGNLYLSNTSGGTGYQNGHIVMGTNHLWFDGAGVLRKKNSAPTSASDGTAIG